MVRLNIGAGQHRRAGYVSIDAYEPRADVRADAADLPYDDNTVDEIVTWHMVERAGFIIERCEAHTTRSGHRQEGDCLCIAHKPEAP